MALPSLIDRALASSGANPTWGMMILVAAWSAVVISALRTVDHLSPLKLRRDACPGGGALCCCKCATRRCTAATAHVWGCLVALCPIDSPLTPFFCVVKRSLTKVAAAQVVAEAVVAWVG